MAEESQKTSEPIDSETLSSSDRNPCPICLGTVTRASYLDQCFHKFCYECILHWIQVVASKHSRRPSSAKCPLCKTENFSIVHGYDGVSFQQHYIDLDMDSSAFFTKAHRYRLQCYYTEPGELMNQFGLMSYWKSRKYLRPNNWLQGWLRREIQALIQEEDVEIIVHHILGVIDSFKRSEQKHSRGTPEMKRKEFQILVSDAARRFLTGRTDRFVDELELFMASGLTISAFDEVYATHLGQKAAEKCSKNGEEVPAEHSPLVPYMFLFDDESDENN